MLRRKIKEPKCPHFKVPCLKEGCTHWQKLRGTNPQTGEPVDEYMCADLWHNILLIENSKLVNETGAAIESFRNEMVGQNVSLLKSIFEIENKKLIGVNSA